MTEKIVRFSLHDRPNPVDWVRGTNTLREVTRRGEGWVAVNEWMFEGEADFREARNAVEHKYGAEVENWTQPNGV